MGNTWFSSACVGGRSVSVGSGYAVIHGKRWKLPPLAKGAKGSGLVIRNNSLRINGLTMDEIREYNGEGSSGTASTKKKLNVLFTLEDGTELTLDDIHVDTMIVYGDVKGSIHSVGDCYVKGNVNRDVNTASGDITIAGSVSGSATTASGDIRAAVVMGDANSSSGDIQGAHSDPDVAAKEAVRLAIATALDVHQETWSREEKARRSIGEAKQTDPAPASLPPATVPAASASASVSAPASRSPVSGPSGVRLSGTKHQRGPERKPASDEGRTTKEPGRRAAKRSRV